MSNSVLTFRQLMKREPLPEMLKSDDIIDKLEGLMNGYINNPEGLMNGYINNPEGLMNGYINNLMINKMVLIDTDVDNDGNFPIGLTPIGKIDIYDPKTGLTTTFKVEIGIVFGNDINDIDEKDISVTI